MMRHALLWMAVLAAAPVVAPHAVRADDGTDSDGDGAVVERAELVVGPGERPIGAVVIDNPFGDLTIEGYDGDSVAIVAVKHAPDGAAVRRLRVTVVPNPDGTVRLTTSIAERREKSAVALATVRIDLVVRVPRAVKVSGRVTTGRLAVANVDAGADLDASTGPISVHNVAGVVFARSLAGSQRFEEVFGPLDSHAVDGDLAFDSVRGARLSAQAYSGDIDGRHIGSRDINMSSVSGNVSLEAEPQTGGALNIASLRGNVSLQVRGTVGLKVRARAGGRLGVPGMSAPAGQWGSAEFGARRDAATVNVSSRFGDVQFGLVQ